VLGWGILRKNDPPRVNFAKVKRQTLVSTLPTNGKVETFEWQSVYAETEGLIDKLAMREGEPVMKDAELATMSNPALQAEIESADARVAEARASLNTLEAGARPADVVAIESSLARTQLDLKQANDDLASLRRLAAKQAATPMEVKNAEDKVRQLELEIQNTEKRRAALVPTTPDLTAARARLRDAEVAVDLARKRATRTVIRAPISGVVYGLVVRQGTFVTAGGLLANIGRLDRLRVRVYVDEPELGRVVLGQPVTIRWQALSGKEWQGAVERKPVSVQALGSRQVGEVVCTIENPGVELIPGTNVDAEIRTAVAESTLVIPREALRHDSAGDFVFLLRGGIVERRVVKTGASSVSLVEITSGLAEGDSVAMPTPSPLSPGDPVAAVQ
jgi:HlyD family secretion protein